MFNDQWSMFRDSKLEFSHKGSDRNHYGDREEFPLDNFLPSLSCELTCDSCVEDQLPLREFCPLTQLHYLEAPDPQMVVVPEFLPP